MRVIFGKLSYEKRRSKQMFASDIIPFNGTDTKLTNSTSTLSIQTFMVKKTQAYESM
jgi:hypothetical protein